MPSAVLSASCSPQGQVHDMLQAKDMISRFSLDNARAIRAPLSHLFASCDSLAPGWHL